MKNFISCDWGTSAFRLRIIDEGTKQVLAETISAQGISATYALWKEQISADRISFYSNIILQQIKIVEKQIGYTTAGLTIVISGMASSTAGMLELPYKAIPFHINKAELESHFIPATDMFPHKIILISGVRSANDVMRGEETILCGCGIKDLEEEQIFIFPGTHSKHLTVKNGMLKDIKTYMTGEVFNLLNSKSILAASVEPGETAANNIDSFIKGVQEAVGNNLLNSIFHVRTSQLFDILNKQQNYHYLSGLLIGGELKDLQQKNNISISVVSSGVLSNLYLEALTALDLKKRCTTQNADAALINGQIFILNQYQ
jgi:2-dehydro-3-deoxygalactonokinase